MRNGAAPSRPSPTERRPPTAQVRFGARKTPVSPEPSKQVPAEPAPSTAIRIEKGTMSVRSGQLSPKSFQPNGNPPITQANQGARRTSAAPSPRSPQGPTNWIPFVCVGAFALILLIVFGICATTRSSTRYAKQRSSSSGHASAPSRVYDAQLGQTWEQWCRSNDKNNPMVQARRQRMGQYRAGRSTNP